MKIEAQNSSVAADEELRPVANGISIDGSSASFMPSYNKNNIEIVPNIARNGVTPSTSGQFLHNEPLKKAIKIANIATSQQVSDSLHQLSKPVTCKSQACLGSLMATQPERAADPRSNEEVLDQAKDFMEQYFTQLQKPNSVGLAQRLTEITLELERTGTYTLTTDELLFGSKTAWRNASRCIGRIQWNKLELQDARHVRNTKEMFDALCKHIDYATNGGNIRSMITIFPQRIRGRDDYRLWNAQLIGFAGYLQSDGSIIGDPAKVQFTRVCERLGWKGKNGRFDILPLVVSAPREGVKFYEIPEELVMRVKIEHQNYPWIKDLGLEWYVLPAVANMMADIGGIQFTASPFNGWYMGTEVGARNFCDPQRYNIMEDVAIRMGLDISNSTSLWKDRVLIEINRAVLYSFQKCGVTIVDHHTASDSFINHMNAEQKQRGGCPADWVWIVPPISGSITSVFHQEMLNYYLRPSFEYQEKAWLSYKWEKSEIRLKYKFVSLVKAILWSAILMNKVMAKRVRATIIYATETGKSETFAKQLAKLVHFSFFVNVKCMEDYDFDGIEKESLLLVVTSTFGNGEAPDNGKEFWRKLNKLSHFGNDKTLINLKYAVFALGSKQYPTFCAFGNYIDITLKSLGATQLIPIGLGDELSGQEKAFQLWANECYKTLCIHFQFDINFSFEEKSFDRQKVRIIEVFIEKNEHQIQKELAGLHSKDIIPFKIIKRVRLQPPQSESQTLFVRLSPSNAIDLNKFDYEPGDHFGIFPSNPKEIVNALLAHLSRTTRHDPNSSILQVQNLISGKWISDSRLPPCSLRVALTNYLDITTPPNQRFLQYLIDTTKDTWDSFRLKKLSSDIEDYEKWRSYKCPNLADVLNEFSSVLIGPELLLTQLPLLQPRFYSISSSRKFTPDEVHLTMGLVRFKTHDGAGHQKYGVCTNYFDRLPEGDIPCFLRSTPGFRLPDNKQAPIIMIGAGSGIAPFRSFWQEREAQIKNGETCGKMFLFFGCRNPKFDNIYGPELTSLLRKGVLHQIFLAFSRGDKKSIVNYSTKFNGDTDYIKQIKPRLMKCLNLSADNDVTNPTDKNCRYVQDQVFKQRSLIFWLLTNECAHIYVCGDSRMADGVRKAVVKLFEIEGNMREKEAQEFVNELLVYDRYHEDVFGIVHK